jgi:hypothetical protein
MTFQASTILDSVAGTLLDTAGRTWTPDELLDYLNEALRTTALVHHDIYVVQTAVVLAAGVQQEIPADGTALIDIPRNTDGRIVTQVDKGLLDEASRFWPAGTQEAVVEHFTADPRNPLRYVIFPPNDGTGVVDLIYAAVPPQVMYAAEEIQIPDSYVAPLLNYVLAKAYMKNSKRQDLAKTNAHFGQWGGLLSLDAAAMATVLPKVSAEPGTA